MRICIRRRDSSQQSKILRYFSRFPCLRSVGTSVGMTVGMTVEMDESDTLSPDPQVAAPQGEGALG